MYPARQQVKNCCPFRQATYINVQNGVKSVERTFPVYEKNTNPREKRKLNRQQEMRLNRLLEGSYIVKFIYITMDHSPINQNFELNKSRQKFHHSLKEHHKISNIPKFRCKML